MSFRLTSRAVALAAVTLVVSGLAAANAQSGGKPRGQPIEFAMPKSDEITTNLHQLTSKKDSLKQLEEDLYKPLESFSPKSSLEGVSAPPPRPAATPVIQSKRVKELLERRKNWVFMTPEDLIAAPTIDDILKTPQFESDGQDKKELPTLQRYYERLSNKRGKLDNPLLSKSDDLFGPASRSKPREEADQRDDANLPRELRESAEALKKLSDDDRTDSPFALPKERRNVTDIFGFEAQTLSKEQLQAHKKLMDDYHSLVDSTWHPPAVAPPANAFSVSASETAAAAQPVASLPSLPSPAPHTGLDAQMDVISPQLGPIGLPDVNALAVGQMRPALAMPSVEAPRVLPPAPTFAAPKRSF